MLPLIRQSPFYPGQIGVYGSDVQRGMRSEPSGIVLYVDDEHPGAAAAGDGTDPEHPLSTIAAAVTSLISLATATGANLEGSVIVVGAGASIAESVIIPPTAPANCAIVGAGNGIDQPTWTAATAAGTALTIRQSGWVVTGFRFTAGAEGTSLRLEWVPASGFVANRCLIQGNYFDGAWVGLYAIDLYGAPYDTWIIGNEFREYQSALGAAYAIICTDSSNANPYMNVIRDNLFWENENHIGSLGNDKSFNLTLFQGNVFHEGVLISATLILDLRGGSQGKNIVVNNHFCGDYSHPGGYYAHAVSPGNWVGNFAEDVAEAQVADNGITIAPPAA